ncbi:hypothetical protein BGL48_08505 [Salinivibrio sp. SS3]|uniref:4'-phosphopantetheinyl transferase family protein n=1 Tax=Salinivibrio sp. SS3 TaxID=1895021 RepID=UPI000847E4A1|nr:4'-phosphopantetheinyl transferase superfamily protein [Salinivibrio sp. BNH]ODP99496.1 hypothetical protein BGL48_08505 [Salinivibrio sp. BNH]
MSFTSIIIPSYTALHVAKVALSSVTEIQRQQLLSQYRPAVFSDWKPSRQASFLAGRAAVAKWQSLFSQDAFSVPRQSDGSPRWPPCWLGSIAHCRTEAVAILHQNIFTANSIPLQGLGIDVECISEALTLASAADLVSYRSERVLFQCLELGYLDPLLAIFCIKESIFKAIYPTIGKYIDFLEVQIIEVDQRGHWNGKVITNRFSHVYKEKILKGVLWEENDKLYSVCLFSD